MGIDNHKSHMTKTVKHRAKDLNMTLVFQPGYSIESLCHVIKSRVKSQLLLATEVRLSQEKFALLVEKSCDSITYEEALRQFGANRNFIRSQLLEMKKKQVMDDDLQLLIDEALILNTIKHNKFNKILKHKSYDRLVHACRSLICLRKHRKLPLELCYFRVK